MEGEDEREPKLYVDVNVANFGLQRITETNTKAIFGPAWCVRKRKRGG